MSERTKAGYIAMLKNGEYPFGGKLPLGISKTKDKKLYYDDDIKIVKEIKDLNLYAKIPLKQIEKVMKDKYPNKNLKWGKSSVERILKNSICNGIIKYNNKEYKFLEPIFTKEEICQINEKNKTFKYLKTTKYYKYHYKLFYANKRMYPSTTVKHLKNGKTRNTIYYLSKCKKVSINEKILDKLLNDTLKDYMSNNNTINSKKLENLKQLYIMEDITLDEYKNMKKDLESKNSLNLSDIAKINVNKNLNITINFTDGKLKSLNI